MEQDLLPLNTEFDHLCYMYEKGIIEMNIYYRIYLFATEEARQQQMQLTNSDSSQNDPYVLKTYYLQTDW